LRCKLCSREAVHEGYCALHGKAYQNLTARFEAWKKALELSWKDYLSEVVKNPFTGTNAREVAEALLSDRL
jgi:hypothetical protein